MSKDRSPTELESDFVADASVVAAGGSPATGPTTLLHIGDEQLVVLQGHGGQPRTEYRLDLGAARIAREFFRHDPPTSLEIERAIDFTEDEIMRLGSPIGVLTSLFSTAALSRPWAAVSGPEMAIEVVEQWFSRLASAALGQPQARQGLPSGREAVAALLVLREFMHHRGHSSIMFFESSQTLVE